MAIFRDYKPSDPIYREGPQSYNPHWARQFLSSRPTSPTTNTDKPDAAASGAPVEPEKRGED
jgi:hypothetical protein